MGTWCLLAGNGCHGFPDYTSGNPRWGEKNHTTSIGSCKREEYPAKMDVFCKKFNWYAIDFNRLVSFLVDSTGFIKLKTIGLTLGFLGLKCYVIEATYWKPQATLQLTSGFQQSLWTTKMDCLNLKETNWWVHLPKEIYIYLLSFTYYHDNIHIYIYVCVCLCIYSLHCILASAQKQAVLRGAEDALRSVRSSGETDPKNG